MIYRIRVREDAPGCYFDWRGWWFLHPMDGLTDRMLDAALYNFGACEIVLAGSGDHVHKTGIINGHFYFDYNPVVAYMAMPELELPKEGADV